MPSRTKSACKSQVSVSLLREIVGRGSPIQERPDFVAVRVLASPCAGRQRWRSVTVDIIVRVPGVADGALPTDMVGMVRVRVLQFGINLVKPNGGRHDGHRALRVLKPMRLLCQFERGLFRQGECNLATIEICEEDFDVSAQQSLPRRTSSRHIGMVAVGCVGVTVIFVRSHLSAATVYVPTDWQPDVVSCVGSFTTLVRRRRY